MKRSKKTSEYATVGNRSEASSPAGEAEGNANPNANANGNANGDSTAPAPGDPLATPELPPATLDERLVALEGERNELKDRMLRLAAEFENWKKRARKEQDDAVTQAREKVLREMLDVIDNLERAVAMQAGGDGVVDGAAVLKGVNLVLRLFQQKLERNDVRPFEAKGQPFDPRQHEAISRVESADVPAGAVANELQKGYRIGDRLLRPAMVAVSSGPKASEG
jgi:molecular chaperone GrpE